MIVLSEKQRKNVCTGYVCVCVCWSDYVCLFVCVCVCV